MRRLQLTVLEKLTECRDERREVGQAAEGAELVGALVVVVGAFVVVGVGGSHVRVVKKAAEPTVVWATSGS